MLSFIEWIRSRVIITKSEEEDQILDEIAADPDFPKTVKRWEILDYLDSRKMGKRKINVIDTYYHEYIKYISHAVPQD